LVTPAYEIGSLPVVKYLNDHEEIVEGGEFKTFIVDIKEKEVLA
jgi:hypothetical protein